MQDSKQQPSNEGLSLAAVTASEAVTPDTIEADLLAHGYPSAFAAEKAGDAGYLNACREGAIWQAERERLDGERKQAIAKVRPATPREALAHWRQIAREIAANNRHPLALANPRQQRMALRHACRES